MLDRKHGGIAAWLAVEKPAESNDETRKNPWEYEITTEDQFAPIHDDKGISMLRKVFDAADVTSAELEITALGVFDVWINGRRVGVKAEDGSVVYDELKPGASTYDKRVLVYTYDVKDYLTEGKNVILAVISSGWWNGRIATDSYGNEPCALLAELKLNGKTALVTDESWQTKWGGPVRAADIWDGEKYDANEDGFDKLSAVDYDASDWKAPVITEHDILTTPHIGPTIRIRKHLERKPVTLTVYDGSVDNGTDFGEIHVIHAGAGEEAVSLKKGQIALYDLGQNMVGVPFVRLTAAKGCELQIRVGEMLNDSGLKSRGNDNPKGSMYTINYRSAKAKAYYVANGSGEEEYRPAFTFFGFRYVEISATEDVEILGFRGLVIGSDIRETGTMETSNKDVNQLISNIIWGQRGNYLSIPTDCPQRDERFGWTGDTQIFCNTAAYNADVDGFFHKWLQDARDSQNDAGAYPDVIPGSRLVGYGAAAWGDAGIVVPYVIWKMFGDTEIVREHYDSMEKYMGYLASRGLKGPRPVYGDWLAYEPTDKTYICVVYYALDARMMAKLSAAIGKTDRADYYQSLYERIRNYFRAIYCIGNGELQLQYRTQTGYLLALRADLLRADYKAAAVKALHDKIVANGYRLSTGFVGAGILNETLAEAGENDLAYSLLLQTENPSWLYSVYQGATTIWERWDSYTLTKGFGNVGMNSFNHYAYGSVQEWMYRHVAGIEVDEAAPGFDHLILQPKPDTRAPEDIPAGQEKITWVNTTFESRRGTIVSNWSTELGFAYHCETPVSATLRLPKLTDADTFTMNGKTCAFADFAADGNAVVMELEPGEYDFRM